MMYKPPHPGKVIKHALIDGAGLTVTEAAEKLGVGRVTLSKIINGKSGISPEMAVRLSIVLNTSSEMWLNMQAMYDLFQAEKKRNKFKLRPLKLKFATAVA
jgi:addiction module HigA family antidote